MDTQPSNSHRVSIDMPWQEAMERILRAVQRECYRLDNDAEHYRDAAEIDPDFSNSLAYKHAIAEKEALQNAYVVITRGY